MSHRFLAATGLVTLVIAVALVAPGNLAGQTDSTTKAAPAASDGHSEAVDSAPYS